MDATICKGEEVSSANFALKIIHHSHVSSLGLKQNISAVTSSTTKAFIDT